MCVWSGSEPNALVAAEGHDGATGELIYYYFRIRCWSSLTGVLLVDGCRNWQGWKRGVCVSGVSPAMLTEEMKAASRASVSAVDVGE